MERIISAVPFILGTVLILAGTAKRFFRQKGGLHIEGTVTENAKIQRKYSKVKTDFEAPVVRYTVNGKEYKTVSRRYYPIGTLNYKKGDKIPIRVSRRNHSHFEPEESGRLPEIMLTGCGIFMIIANGVILWRY